MTVGPQVDGNVDRAPSPDEPPPDRPTEIPAPGWRAILKRALAQFKHDNITDRAAALTYFGVLAMFPGVLVLVSAPKKGRAALVEKRESWAELTRAVNLILEKSHGKS